MAHRIVSSKPLETLHLGDHACLFYRTRAELVELTTAYVALGLQRNERCLCVFDEACASELRARLRAYDVMPGESAADCRCVLRTDNVYLADGAFDPERMGRVLGHEVQNALDAGFSGLRAVGEMSWTLDPAVDQQLVTTYEAMMNQFYPRSPAVGLCLYSLPQSPPDLIERTLWTHPQAIHNGHLCDNPFYQPPDLILERHPAHRVNWMLGRLHAAV